MTELVSFFVATLELVRHWVTFSVWQSSVILGVSLIVVRYFRHTPWSSHLILMLGIFAGTLAPLFSLTLAQFGGGLVPVGSLFALEKQFGSLARIGGPTILVGSILFVSVLFYGILSARRLIFHAHPFPDRESQEALLEGSKTMRNVSIPILFTSSAVKCPTVWSWGLHPAVLLPESLSKNLSREERDVIFMHELAHIVRRDHLAVLLTRLCGVLLFWNPLYWIALWLCDLAADESCDLLVISEKKVSPEVYGETLLRLAVGEKKRPLFQCLSRKEQLMKRINTIYHFLENRDELSAKRNPLQIAVMLICVMLLTTTLVFCQEQKKETVEEQPAQRSQVPGVETQAGRMTHLIVFGPAGDFAPKNPMDYLNIVNPKLGEFGVHAGYFRSKPEDGKLIAYNLTSTPEEYKKLIDSVPQMKYIRTEPLTQEMFNKYEKTAQESLPSPHLAEVEKSDWFAKLNEDQKQYVRWEENQFAYANDPANYNVYGARDAFEKRWIATLEKPESGNPGFENLSPYDEAIFGLAILKSDKAAKLLTKIAAEKVVKDNAHRHFATKALGMLGDVSVIPELIPLLYHYNFNARWEAQIALVRLTGQNFGSDADAWGKWYNANRKKLGKDLPPFDPKPVDWSCGSDNKEIQWYCKPEVQKESDNQFFGKK
ncbi:MAG: M56 family metallopeptidase [Thermoguttaceae bacterium]